MEPIREAEEQAKDFDKDAIVQTPEEREHWFQSPGFSRMRTDWEGPDAGHMLRARQAIDDYIKREFGSAFEIMNDIHFAVREILVDEDGVVIPDDDGNLQWRTSPTGQPIEDYSRLTTRQKEDFLFRIVTNIFTWSQKVENMRTEAMFAKAIWTEHFAVEFGGAKGTVDARNAAANEASAEDRLFALFKTGVSRKAEALVSSMQLICQRIKDTLDS